MKFRISGFLSFFALLALSTTTAHADQLVLKNGKEFSGKFLRANTNLVEFRTGGKVQVHKTIDVSKIIFLDPTLSPPVPQRGSKRGDEQTETPVRHVPPEPLPILSATFHPGTGITIRTTSAVDTDQLKVGDSFAAILEDPLMHDNHVVVPRGAEVRGRIRETGRLAGKSELALELVELTANGKIHPLKTGDYSEVGSSRDKRPPAVPAQLALKGQPLKIPAETVLEFKLEAALKLPLP